MEPLDQQRAIVGNVAGGLTLLVEVRQQVGHGELVEAGRSGPCGRPLGPRRRQLPQERADRPAQLGRPARRVAVPERQLARLSRGRRHQHPVGGDVLDAPRAGAEHEHVADPRLVHHLLVELADPGGPLTDEEHPEQAPVGDGAAAGDREPLRARPAAQRAGHPIPHDARAQLGELLARVAPGEHVQRGLQGAARQRGVGRGALDHGLQLVDRPLVERGHGHDLLGEHVERVARVAQLLDGAGPHALGDHGRLHQVATVLGEDHAAGHGADLVPGAADALQPARHARRRLDAGHQVDRAHVDAELEAGGGHHGRQPPGLQRLLGLRPLLLGHRTVVRPHHFTGRPLGRPRPAVGAARADPGRPARLRRPRQAGAAGARRALPGPLTGSLTGGRGGGRPAVLGELVEPGAQAFRETAGVGEHDRGAVGLDEVEQTLLDVRPDAAPLLGRLVAQSCRRHLGHVLHRHDDVDLDGLALRRLHHRRRSGTAQEGGHLAHRPHRRRQADALGRPLQQRVEPLQAEREMGTALGAGDRVHLVDDDGAHAAQRLARLPGEDQEQRLGRGDQDVGRVGGEPPAILGGGVARADRHRDVGHRQAEPPRGLLQPGERRAQVALDVDGERLQRRDVDDAASPLARPPPLASLAPLGRIDRLGRLGRPGHALGGQPVERPQERREGLAGPRGRDHQRVVTAGDRRPRPLLRGGGTGEGSGEPLPGHLGELVERHGSILPARTDTPI